MGYIGAGVTRFNTADELTVTGDAQIDTTTLVVDSTNNRVGIGTASPATALDVSGTITADNLTMSDSSTPQITLTDTTNSVTGVVFADNGEMELGTTSNHAFAVKTNDTERLRITNGGNVGIGETAPANLLHVKASDTGIAPHASAQIVLEREGTNYLQFLTAETGTSGILFGDGSDVDVAQIKYDHSTTSMQFVTEASEAFRIDSSGNLLVGKTTTVSNTAGHSIYSSGAVEHTRDSNTVLYVNRTTTDGNIAEFRKDGTTVGSISTTSGDIEINSASGSSKNVDIIGRDSGGNARGIAVGSGSVRPTVDNAIDLGTSSFRFKQFYLSGGVYLGGTATANHLDDYERGSYTITETNGDCTITSHRGTYVKVGDLVYVSGSFTVGSNSNGNVLHLSLPFTSTIGLNGIGGGNISFTNFNSTYVDANLRPCVENLASNFFFRWSQNNLVTCANVSGNRADFMVIYEAA